MRKFILILFMLACLAGVALLKIAPNNKLVARYASWLERTNDNPPTVLV